MSEITILYKAIQLRKTGSIIKLEDYVKLKYVQSLYFNFHIEINCEHKEENALSILLDNAEEKQEEFRLIFILSTSAPL